MLASCSKSNQASNDIDSKISVINKKFTYRPTAKYDLYIGLLGNVGYVQINDIKNGKIDYNKPYIFNFKKKGLNVGSLVSSQSRIFTSIHDDSSNGSLQNKTGMGEGKKVATLDKNKITNYINFPKHFGLEDMLIDTKKHKAYVMCAVQPARYNKSGTPFVAFNTMTNKPQKTINIKGILAGYAIKGNYIYMAIYGAKKLDYTDVPDEYIATLNRETNKIKVLTAVNNGKVLDLAIGSKTIYVLKSTTNNSSELDTYELNGKSIDQIPLSSNPAHIVLNDKGLLYMSNLGSQYDGKSVSVFDTHTGKVITDIKGFVGAGMMTIKDHYLFVDNEGRASVSVVDMDTNKIIGTIDFGLGQGSHGLAIN